MKGTTRRGVEYKQTNKGLEVGQTGHYQSLPAGWRNDVPACLPKKQMREKRMWCMQTMKMIRESDQSQGKT